MGIAGSLHRPIAANVERRIHIENTSTEAWDFDGLCVYTIRDDRAPQRPLPGTCEQYFAQPRGLQMNEPVAIEGRVYTFDQDPQAISLRKKPFDLTADRAKILDLPRAIAHAPLEPIGDAPSPIDLGSATGFQTIDCAGFRVVTSLRERRRWARFRQASNASCRRSCRAQSDLLDTTQTWNQLPLGHSANRSTSYLPVG